MRREQGNRYVQARNPDAESGGIVRLSGSFLLDHEEELLNLVRKEGRLSEERNKNSRIIKIDKEKSSITVTTSCHNLAQRIGKALHSAYRGEHQLKWREGEKFAEVLWARD